MIINIPIIGGGEEVHIDISAELLVEKEQFLAIRQRESFIEEIFTNNENLSSAITGNPVLMYYIMEYQTGISDDSYGQTRDSGGYTEEPIENESFFYDSSNNIIRDAVDFLRPKIFRDALHSYSKTKELVEENPVLMSVINTMDWEWE